MRFEAKLFGFVMVFFFLVGVIYGLWSGWEPVGSTALLLTGGLAFMISGYLYLVSRRIDARPEDDPSAEIADGAGDMGVFSPWSWWPIAAAAAAALIFAGLAAGWWIAGIGVVFGVVATVGWMFEFSRGIHAH